MEKNWAKFSGNHRFSPGTLTYQLLVHGEKRAGSSGTQGFSAACNLAGHHPIRKRGDHIAGSSGNHRFSLGALGTHGWVGHLTWLPRQGLHNPHRHRLVETATSPTN